MGLSENSVPLHPMVLLIIIPTKWHWRYTPFSDIPICFFWHFQQFNLVWKIQNSSLPMKPQPSAIFLSAGIRSLEPKSHIVATCEDKKRPIQNPSGVCGMEWQWCCRTLDISGYFFFKFMHLYPILVWFLLILSSLIYFVWYTLMVYFAIFCCSLSPRRPFPNMEPEPEALPALRSSGVAKPSRSRQRLRHLRPWSVAATATITCFSEMDVDRHAGHGALRRRGTDGAARGSYHGAHGALGDSSSSGSSRGETCQKQKPMENPRFHWFNPTSCSCYIYI